MIRGTTREQTTCPIRGILFEGFFITNNPNRSEFLGAGCFFAKQTTYPHKSSGISPREEFSTTLALHSRKTIGTMCVRCTPALMTLSGLDRVAGGARGAGENTKKQIVMKEKERTPEDHRDCAPAEQRDWGLELFVPGKISGTIPLHLKQGGGSQDIRFLKNHETVFHRNG